MHTSRSTTVTSWIRLILQHQTWCRHIETRQSTSEISHLQYSDDTEIYRWLQNPIKYGCHNSTPEAETTLCNEVHDNKKNNATNHTDTRNYRYQILTSYCSISFSWAQNHLCVDSPFPSDLRAELRTKDEAKFDLSGLELLLLLEPASGGGGDGESALTRFASSPFITGLSSSFFTWIKKGHELNITMLKLQSSTS